LTSCRRETRRNKEKDTDTGEAVKSEREGDLALAVREGLEGENLVGDLVDSDDLAVQNEGHVLLFTDLRTQQSSEERQQ
jgi:hypothetical protein